MNLLPEGPLLTYYGDDFTGSSAVMEVMAFAGLPSVMFLAPPTPERLALFSDRRCIGIAGIARSKPPEWMDENLPPIYQALAALNAPLTHYKVCSTFDSAPAIGSIGRAIDLAASQMPASWIPLITGAPPMARYQAFGNLFAGVDGTAHRLDRHPTMARHPVTPMNEADLGQHLARQTKRRIALIDLVALKAGKGTARLASEIASGDCPIISLDVLDDATMIEAGKLLWENRQNGRFVAGSQGVEYALVAYWRAAGLIPAAEAAPPVKAQETIAVLSGSCSPVTAQQIAFSETQGFRSTRIDVTRATDRTGWREELALASAEALASLSAGQSPLIYTARGPDDPAISALNEACRSAGCDTSLINERIGAGLGDILSTLIDQGGVRRAVIAGGDTSGHATLTLGIDALSAIAPIATGAPLCRAYADNPARDGLELALKGGQGGGPDYFCIARAGGTTGIH